MKNKIRLAVSAVALVLIVSGCVAEAAPAEEVNRQIPITLLSMKRDFVEHTYLSVGEVVPNNQVDVFIPGTGAIDTINVKTGDVVEEGMLLIQMDGSEIDMTNYNATESQLRTVRDNISGQLSSLKETYERQASLYNEGIITRVEFDQSKNQVDSLQREYNNAKVAYSNQLASIKDGLEDAAESRLLESTVSGLVAGVYVKEGQSASNQLALTIVDDSRLFIRTYISGDLKKSLTVGDSLRIRVEGDEDQIQDGIIHEIQTLPDRDSKLFEVRIEVTDPSWFVIGDYAEIEFIVERYEAILVPTQGVIRKGTEQFVYIYSEDILEQRQIDPGRTSGNWVEAKQMDGLYDVVVKGQNQLKAGGEPVVVD